MVDSEGKQMLLSENRPNYSSISNDDEELSSSPQRSSDWRGPERIHTRNRLLTILFGQCIALAGASANAASFTLENGMNKVFPMFLMFPVYTVMSFNLWSRQPLKDEENYRVPLISIRLRMPWLYYVCLSVLDLLPNYLTLISLKHTSLTSATLLGSLTVPSTMVVCSIVLSKRFKLAHYFGVIVCLIGGALTLIADFHHSSHQSSKIAPSHPHSYYGDILAILAAILYGIGDATGEFWTKHVNRKEYLGMLGLHGSVVSLIFCLLFERQAVSAIFVDNETVLKTLGIFIWYVPSVVSFYTFASLFLISSDATLLTLSLQSSNLWAILFSTVAFRESPSSSFWLAVVFVVCGVSIYEILGNSLPRDELEDVCRDSDIEARKKEAEARS